MKRYIRCSVCSKDTLDILDDMMYQVYENYNSSEDNSEDMIVDIWLEHVQENYIEDSSVLSEDNPTAYQELCLMSEKELRSIGMMLYNNYQWM